MAVNPTDSSKLFEADLATVAELEKDIDTKLSQRSRQCKDYYFPSKTTRWAVASEVVRRFRAAGWDIKFINGEDENLLLGLKFSPSQSPAS